MSKWWFPYTLTPEQEAAGVGESKLPKSWPKGAEVDLCNDFFGKIYESRKRLLNHEKDYCEFIILCTAACCVLYPFTSFSSW
jgi:hypothetical protein